MRMSTPAAPPSAVQAAQPFEVRPRVLALIAIGTPVLIYFGVTAALAGDWPLFGLLAATVLAVGITFVTYRKGTVAPGAVVPVMLCLTVLMLYVVRHSGPEHSRALWFFILPVIILTSQPPRIGAIWSFAAIAAAVAIMVTTPDSDATTAYAPAFVVRFAITASVIAGVVLWSEILMLRYREAALSQTSALAAEAQRLEEEVAQRKALELERRVLATTDPLTDLLNRRAFFSALESELQRSLRLGRPLALIVLDVDHFKDINDRYGHPTGDAALAHLSRVLRHTLRGIDLFGRIGGEEFAAVLLETDVTATPPIGERLLTSVRSSPVTLADGTHLPMTISIGGSQAQPEDTVETLVKRADDALYQAKADGRDRYCAR